MGWAATYIEKLLDGEIVQFRPRGHSMTGKVNSGSLVTVEPLTKESVLRKGDIVLCKVKKSEYLHLIKSIFRDRFLIGNNRGGTNGWIERANIYGKCTKVEK
jgi:SOS-response transcriptional repressor LexA